MSDPITDTPAPTAAEAVRLTSNTPAQRRADLRSRTIGRTLAPKVALLAWAPDVDGKQGALVEVAADAPLPEGHELAFEVRQPSIGERHAIVRESREEGAANSAMLDLGKLAMLSLVDLTYAPGTNERVYSRLDLPVLEAQPEDGWLAVLAGVAVRMFNGGAGLNAGSSSAKKG